jgi:hypothetical protein
MNGHGNVVNWLFETGAANDIETKHIDWGTSVLHACWFDHLDLIKWLFEVGAA